MIFRDGLYGLLKIVICCGKSRNYDHENETTCIAPGFQFGISRNNNIIITSYINVCANYSLRKEIIQRNTWYLSSFIFYRGKWKLLKIKIA